jgi:putative inorganic carbon (HCO3(-)) transporter
MPERTNTFFPVSLKDPPERIAFLCLAGSVSLSLVSIAASQILLAAALAATLWLRVERGRDYLQWPPFTWPLLAFCLWTLLAIFLSRAPQLALLEAKKFFLYLVLFLVPTLVRGKGSAVWIYRTVFLVAVASCLKGIEQFISNPHRGLLDRISGFMSQWMTYSGLLMLVLVALSAFICHLGWRRHLWILPLALLLATPLYLSETRSAQWGALAGIVAVMLIRRKVRAVAALLAILLLVYIASPASIRRRLSSGFDPEDPNTRNRIELFSTALRLIQDKPWIGVGPKNVGSEALRYRGSREWPDWMYQHMHNNFLQIAAERGIPGLLIWLWLMGRLAWDALRVFRASGGFGKDDPPESDEALLISTAALGAWISLLVAGMVEYNFGDSEVLTLFLFMMGASYSFLERNHSRSTEHMETGATSSVPQR